ncbi:MAG: hypothetical protein CL910_12230 [Deltaproteobacteria bacterium]|jgi:cytochrome c-type biogenesis protein CcmE|nr:hypothetical protein [Deltaproteobacteria bacterium]
MSKGVQIAIGGALVVLLLGWYGASQVAETSFAYYQTLEEFRAHPEAATRAVRVHGYVAAGSIERDVEARQVSFSVQETPPHAGGATGTPMHVVYASLETPDLFKDGAEVVVEGRLGATGTFDATNVLAKCPSKFEGVEPGDERSNTAVSEGREPPGTSS